MKQVQHRLGTITALVLLGILATITLFSFTALKHTPQTAETTFQSVLPTPTTRVTTTATPSWPKKDSRDIVLTYVPPEIVPDILTEPVQITTRPAPRGELAVDGNYVVWSSYEDGQTNVVAYDLQTGEQMGVGLDTSNPRSPDVSDSIVVWHDFRSYQSNEETDIYGWDLKHRVEFPIVVGSGRHLFPRVSGGWIIYLDWLPGAQLGTPYPDQPTLHAHSIRTGEDINLGPVSYRNDAWSYKRHVISGHMVAWQGRDGATHLYDLAARRERLLTELQSYDNLILNGRFLSSGTRLYNVETGAQLAPFQAFSIERPAPCDRHYDRWSHPGLDIQRRQRQRQRRSHLHCPFPSLAVGLASTAF